MGWVPRRFHVVVALRLSASHLDRLFLFKYLQNNKSTHFDHKKHLRQQFVQLSWKFLLCFFLWLFFPKLIARGWSSGCGVEVPQSWKWGGSVDVLDWDSTRVLNWMDMKITSRVRKENANTMTSLSHTLFPSIFFKSCAFFNDHQLFLPFFFLWTQMTTFSVGFSDNCLTEPGSHHFLASKFPGGMLLRPEFVGWFDCKPLANYLTKGMQHWNVFIFVQIKVTSLKKSFATWNKAGRRFGSLQLHVSFRLVKAQRFLDSWAAALEDSFCWGREKIQWTNRRIEESSVVVVFCFSFRRCILSWGNA